MELERNSLLFGKKPIYFLIISNDIFIGVGTYITYLILSTSNEPILGNKYSHKKISIKYIFQNKIILGKFFNKLHFAMNVRFLANSTSDKNNNEIFIPENKMFQYLALIKGTGPSMSMI